MFDCDVYQQPHPQAAPADPGKQARPPWWLFAVLFVPLVLVVACEVLQLLAEIWPNLQKYIAFLGAAMVASTIFTPVIVLPYCCYLSFRRVRSQAAQPR